MVIVDLPKTALGMRVRGKVGRALLFGQRIYGWCWYGLQEPSFCSSSFGVRIFGDFFYNDQYPQWGIFQVTHGRWWSTNYRRDFYMLRNKRSIPQQANRQVYADGIVAWQSLTAEQKAPYNVRAKWKKMSGFNLFLKEYLLSH